MPHLPRGRELLSESWNLLKAHGVLVLSTASVFAVVGVLLSVVGQTAQLTFLRPELFDSMEPWSAVAAVGLGGVLLILAGAAYFLWSQSALYVAITKRESTMTAWGACREGLTHILPFGWVLLLYALAVVGGLVLLVIPGLYLMAVYSFAPIIYFVEGERGIAALKKSRAYVRGRFWSIMGKNAYFCLIVIGLYILFAVATALGAWAISLVVPFAFAQIYAVFEQWGTFLNDALLLPFGIVFYYVLYRHVSATVPSLEVR